jgi:hypothetical protein
MTTAIAGSQATTRAQSLENDAAADTTAATTTTSLPPPGYPDGPPADDLQTALAVLMIETSRDRRRIADKQRDASAKAQEEAHATKIAKMRELADDTFTQGLVDGVFQGVSGAAQAGAACLSFSSTIKDISAGPANAADRCSVLATEAAELSRASKLLDASSKLTSAAGTIWSAGMKSAQERDREAMAAADHDIDRAKGAVDGASTDSKRAQEDIRETINYVRQYLAAKTQAAQAGILKG